MMLQQQAGMAELRNQQEAFHERQQRLQLESAMQVQTQWQQQQVQLQKQQLRNEQQIERRLERHQHGLSGNIQALADRLAPLESLKPPTPQYERGVKPGSQFLMPEHSQAHRSLCPESETPISKVHFEESLEHEKRRMQREFDDKLAQQAQSADVGQKNWLTNAQNALEERERMLNSQWYNFEQQLKKREEEWKLEREAMATGMQNQMLTVLQAALSQIAPHLATVRAVAAKNSQAPIVGASPTVASIQQSVAADQARDPSSQERHSLRVVEGVADFVSREANGVASCEEDWRRKEESTSSSSKRSQPKKAQEPSDPPPDDPDESGPCDSDNDASRGGSSDSSDAEGFSSEDEDIGMTTTTTTADGTTIWNCRQYIGYTNLE
ncbi:hypothetical protein PHMEG_00034766 [Phytophthora megakarya]|uniref:Uncharacterized protein n=1 Tax=Phytophthora megakarya TaxID=4795 RepID=A0A225UQ98_9STRA|nr:hypothetical protein PHMEG_00034766 [Phytophthora megakarya]